MELGALLGCVLGLFIVAAIAVLIVVLLEWGLVQKLGLDIPAIIFQVLKFIVAVLVIAWLLECLGVVTLGLHSRPLIVHD